MSIAYQASVLSRIIIRYFDKSHKQIIHYGDCSIYLADRPFCGCGFLHQLYYLNSSLATIVYPKFEKDNYLQATGKKLIKSKKKEAETLAILESVFGKIDPPTISEIKYDYDKFKAVL